MIGYAEVKPSADLAPFVQAYWALAGRAPVDAALGNRILPDGCSDVIVHATDPDRVFAVGTMTVPAVVHMRGALDVFGVRFRPGAAASVLGVPASAITDTRVALADLWQEAEEVLEATLGAAPVTGLGRPALDLEAQGHVRGHAVGLLHALKARARRMEGVLRRRLMAGGQLDTLVMGALHWISASAGRTPIRQIEDRLGVTGRTLERRFAHAVGVSPKVACRIARFQAASRQIRQDPDTPLARLAVRCGFHDQAHMTREFTRLAGLPPAAYAHERRVGFVQDLGSIPA